LFNTPRPNSEVKETLFLVLSLYRKCGKRGKDFLSQCNLEIESWQQSREQLGCFPMVFYVASFFEELTSFGRCENYALIV
jgi:hypothetical protein